MEDDLYKFTSYTEQKMTDGITRLFVVRHGESFANTEGKYQGQTYDTDLSNLGKRQAKALAERVKDFGIKKIIASPLKRTYQTAFEVSKICDCSITINNLIIETNHGKWEGNSKDWIKENYEEEYETWMTNPSNAVFPFGETFKDTLKRVEDFLAEEILEDNTLLVTHDNIVRILATLANGWQLDDIWKHNVEPASLNYFEVNRVNGKSKLKTISLNDNSHLVNLKADLSKHAL